MPIECAPTTVQGTRAPPLSKQPVPMSLGGATTPHHALQPSHKVWNYETLIIFCFKTLIYILRSSSF